MTTETYSVQTIRDYLLGLLPEEETERLDELSVTDDECAGQIRAVEYDLVDAFARGELRGAALEQFRARYLATPRRREAVRFAEALQSFGQNLEGGHSSGVTRASTPVVRERRRWPQLLALAAAIVLAIATAWLALDNRTLRARVTSAESARGELERGQQLREAEARRTPAAAPASTLTVATLVLSPQLRGARQLPTVALAGSSGDLPVQLELEPVDYPAYDASLVASNGDLVLWRTNRLIARTTGARKTINLRLPATMLSPQAYLIRLFGVPSRGASEIAGEYRFIVVK